MTLGDIRTDLYSRLGYGSTPAAEVASRLDRFVNEAQRELITMRGLARLRRNVLTFSCIANSPFCVLPQAAVRIAGIQDRTTQKSLREISIQDLRYVDPGLTRVTSNPDQYAIINLSAAVAVDINRVAGSELYVVSDNAGDTATCYIQGVTASGYSRVEHVLATGTTQVVFAGTDWLYVQKFYSDAAAVGNIKLIQPSPDGLTYNPTVNIEIARIPVGKFTSRYTRLHLFGTPSTALTYYADVDLHVDDLASAGDTSLIPEDFHWVLLTGALKKESWKRKDWESYGSAKADWADGVASLKAFCRQGTDDGHTGRPSQFSQLGPWFRAGS